MEQWSSLQGMQQANAVVMGVGGVGVVMGVVGDKCVGGHNY